MKKLIAIAIAATALAGCQSSSFEKHITRPDGIQEDVSVSIWSHWLKRDVDKFSVTKTGDGYTIDMNGYKSDASEQLPAFTREMWAGLGILGRIAATTINPAASAVPLTSEPANAADVAALVKATNEAKVALANAQAELAKVKAASASSATSGSSSDCADGSCTK